MKDSRRRFLKASLIGVAANVLSDVSMATAPALLEGYASTTSLLPGESISFCVSNFNGNGSFQSCSVSIVRRGAQDQAYISTSISVTNEVTPAQAYTNGCNWPSRYSLTIPSNWPSGLYVAAFWIDSASYIEVPFVVRASQPGKSSNVLVQVPFTTMQAYNNWPGLARNGKSLYDQNSVNGRATTVSFDRPFDPNSTYGQGHFINAFVPWLEQNGYVAEYCSSLDLHNDPTLLSHYQLLVTAGHDEYWSLQMRNNVDQFVLQGGNFAIFGGNTCWWQVRFEPNQESGASNRAMICYKSAAADPISDPSLKTDNWFALSPPNPENSTTGLTTRSGAIWQGPDGGRPSTPFIVNQADHWVFVNTNVTNGQAFAGAWVGYETDALDLTSVANKLVPTGNDGSPQNFQVLAISDATDWPAYGVGSQPGHAVLGLFENNGTVFNAGVTDWTYGLQSSTADGAIVQAMTKNVLNKLSMAKTPLQKATLNVYQYHAVQANGDGNRYFFSTSPLVNSGWTFDGPAFLAFNAMVADTVPVYVYYVYQANGDGIRHCYSMSPTLGGGWIFGGTSFFAFPDASLGGVPVYQYYAQQENGDGVRFYYSVDPNVTSGWTRTGIAFYVPPSA